MRGGSFRLRFSFGLKKQKVIIQMDPTRKLAGAAAAESFSQCQIFYCATDFTTSQLVSPAAIIQPQSLRRRVYDDLMNLSLGSGNCREQRELRLTRNSYTLVLFSCETIDCS